jgi:uncharacterized membrane protein YcgQ (UPF0703/DUF1980 family)
VPPRRNAPAYTWLAPAAIAAASYPEDTWLRLEGTAVTGSSTAASSFVPKMNVKTVTKIDRPANTYAY